jgi:hypothetical protein
VIGALAVQLTQGPPNTASLVLIGLATVLLFGLFAPHQTTVFLQRMKVLKVVGVVEFALDAVVSAEVVRPPGEEEDGIVSSREGEDYEQIIEELKTRMRFIHAITDLRYRVPGRDSYEESAFVLAADGLLDPKETRFVLDLLSERDWGLDELPVQQREEFLDAAWSFATRIRFVVWDRFVRRELRERGWVIADFDQAKGHRRDFLACWRGQWVLMTARVGGRKKVTRYPATRRRMAKARFKVPIMGRCIVVPGRDLEGPRKARLATVASESGEGVPSSVKVLELQGALRENAELGFLRSGWNDDAEQRARPLKEQT